MESETIRRKLALIDQNLCKIYYGLQLLRQALDATEEEYFPGGVKGYGMVGE